MPLDLGVSHIRLTPALGVVLVAGSDEGDEADHGSGPFCIVWRVPPHRRASRDTSFWTGCKWYIAERLHQEWDNQIPLQYRAQQGTPIAPCR